MRLNTYRTKYHKVTVSQCDSLSWVYSVYYSPILTGKSYTGFYIMDDYGFLAELDQSITSGQFVDLH